MMAEGVLFAGNSHTAKLMGGLDWAASPLGAPTGWSSSLTTIVNLLLQSKFPMFVAWGPELGFLYNDAYADILGTKHPKAMGQPFKAIWSEIWDDIEPLIDAALRGEATYQQNLPLVMNRHGFAEQTWFTFSYSPVRDDDGQIRGMFCAVQESTEQVVVQRRDKFRLTLERRVRELADPKEIMTVACEALGRELDIARVGYGEIDEDGRHVIVERDWTDGRIPTVVGRYLMDDFGPEIIKELKARRTMWVDDVTSDPRVGPSAAAFAAIQTRSVLAVPLFKADRFAAMLYLHHPNPHRWDPSEVALARDVVEQTWQAVERARAEAELRELNKTLEQRIADAIAERDASEAARREADALYRAYFKHAPEALFIVAVTADGRFVVEEVNPAHEAGVGFPIDQIRGKSLDEVLPADAFAKVALAYHRVLETGETYHYREAFNLHGVAQHWETSIVPVRDKSGRISRLFGASRDVTRQVMADETLRQAQKMEAIGQLTGGVAHDFNNLLTPILGSLDMLKRRGLGGEREQRLVLNALQSAERARTLVQRLLAFARRQPLQPAAVDVAQLVDSLAELLASTIGPQIKLSVEAPNGLPPARADANQLEMALLNIVVNARDAMPEGGMIRITVSDDVVTSAHREELSPGHYIHLSVADTGSGMDDATLARAVEPFFSTKGIGRGTGLGLSMVHGLASQLGGQLTIKSKPGLGTNVELWLPAIEEGAVADTLVDPPQHQVPAAKGRVLLVDDDDAVRRTAADMLEELGYLVEEASSGEEALQLIDDGLRPDLVVTDHLMSGMTGIQLIRGLVARGLDMPTLLVSGYAELEGADTEVSRLSKPFRPDELADKLATMASKAKPLSPDLTDAN